MDTNLYKMLNSFNIDVKDDPNIKEPKHGDKVVITDWSSFETNEAVKHSKKDFLVVNDVMPMPVGENGDYHWEYHIYVKELHGLAILPNEYKLI